MPVFEDLIALALFLGGGGLIVVYGIKFVTVLIDKVNPKDPAAEVIEKARKRVALSKAELEAARLEKEAQQNYDALYKEALEDLNEEFSETKKVK